MGSYRRGFFRARGFEGGVCLAPGPGRILIRTASSPGLGLGILRGDAAKTNVGEPNTPQRCRSKVVGLGVTPFSGHGGCKRTCARLYLILRK